MRAWVLPVIASFAGSVAAQTLPRVDPKVEPSAGGHGSAPQQSTAPSRNQFFSPVMGIQIEAQGLTLPKGVAEDPLAPPTAPQPAAEQKPPEQPTQK